MINNTIFMRAVVCVFLMSTFCIAFRRAFPSLTRPSRGIITLPFNYRQFSNSQEIIVDMTKSKTFNSIKAAVKKSITRSADNASYVFKTGPGEYAAHDRFLGVSNPDIRKIAKEFKSDVTLNEIQWLLDSEYNEERFLGLVLLVDKYDAAAKYENKTKKSTVTAPEHTCEHLYKFYMSNLPAVNNWNLVDLSSHLIVGPYLADKNRDILHTLIASPDLWERRVAMLATLHFIRNSDLDWTFDLAEQLLNDPEDLMHKASGWMLREAGKKDVNRLRGFLDKHAATMPRMMLRYSIEKLSAAERKHYLKMKKIAAVIGGVDSEGESDGEK